MLRTQRERAERVLAFADELALAIKREMPMLWTGALESSRAALLVERVDGLQTRVREGRETLHRLVALPAGPALAALQQLNLDGLTTDGRGLDALARQVRQELGLNAAPPPSPPASPSPPARGTGLLAGRPGATGPLGPARTGNLMGKLREIVGAAQAPAPPPPPPPAPPPEDPARQAFDRARQLVSEVMAYVSPRLSVLGAALRATGLPGRKRPWPEVEDALEAEAASGEMAPANADWLEPVAELFYDDMGATRVAHGAVVQWQQACTLHQDADLLVTSLESTPRERHRTLLGHFNLGQYRAAVYPISHLHVTFKGVPLLSALFPPPA